MDVQLPSLLQFIILKENDPRLYKDIVETSIYFCTADFESPASPTSEMDSRTAEPESALVKEIPSKRDELMSSLVKRQAEQEEAVSFSSKP